MENLYHQTNRLILETQELFHRLESSKSEAVENDIQSKISTISRNCEQLVILVNKEPISRRNNAKLRVDQLKYDYQHLQIALKTHQQNQLRRLRAEQEREELLNRRFTRNPDINDTTILIDHTIQHQNSLQKTNKGIDKNNECDEILNSILPPIEWEEGGQKWRQKVSNEPATRIDVIKLTEMLDMNLQHLQARETGICPIRRVLYSQCFDEIIRQVTINCAERGILLLKIRDELNMTIDAYKTLYESSIAFGIRKSLSAEHNKIDLQDKLTELEVNKQKLKIDLETAIKKYEMNQRQSTEKRIAEQQRHNEEINMLKRSNQQLKAQLEV
ncbi:axonemal dynein light intermediate polypeptide 1-like isoform X3 [Daktulosphaira vitifoliae]|uniref:axonemal dynein light intermediate polypeptide 1-like isoform X2 n=1 Tax=Daktulosphaira vitifoliae TaxID=58002 RepID=UPI0021A9EB33|nr:axonemal dynein light intermediate polypeptide 1-like isoform X2 [Daktulosphaira vitifoliae]XP_050545762.1 axonemal dynein light intermediate polypeptide 1-like isoform X3 [Daktulosphaira vitifoliae]